MRETREQTQKRLNKFFERRSPSFHVRVAMGVRQFKGRFCYVNCDCHFRPKKGWLGGYEEYRVRLSKEGIFIV